MESKKRKRATTTTNNNKRIANLETTLPDIPGVPVPHIPYFLQALKDTTKFFQKRETPFTIVEWEERHSSSTSSSSSNRNGDNLDPNNHGAAAAKAAATTENNVHDTIMNRMADVVVALENDDDGQQAASRLIREEVNRRRSSMEAKVSRWMEDVKRYASTNRPKTSTVAPTDNENDTSEGAAGNLLSVKTQDEKPSVPFAIFLYLWQMQQEHNRVAVRRSALFLSALLLQKSRDCRYHLEQEAVLMDWVTSIVAQGVEWKNAETAAAKIPLLQREAVSMLSHLIKKGYAKLYPKIGVAAKSLRHQCPNVNVSEVSTLTTSMVEWRKLRDVALLYGKREIAVLEKLVSKADRCLEVLFPRFVNHEDNSTGQQANHSDDQKGESDQSKEDQGEDDDDIDWEDGDNFDDGIGSTKTSSTMETSCVHQHLLHLSAVDRTMAAMKSSMLLRGQEFDIDLGKHEQDDVVVESAATQSDTEGKVHARQKLVACSQKLSTRHLPRLSGWLDGLRNADNLVMGSSSLVSLTSKDAKARLDLLERLSVWKQEATRILAAALRLDIKQPTNEKSGIERIASLTGAKLQLNVAPNLMGGSCASNDRLNTVWQQGRRQKAKQTRSKRIRIKCRSR